MNFRLRNSLSVILMSVRVGAPYADQFQDEGRTLIYEGHDIPRASGGPDPKVADQPYITPNGTRTQKGRFFDAAQAYKRGDTQAEQVRVFEKIRDGIWVYNGIFLLSDAWQEQASQRKIFKFRLELSNVHANVNNTIGCQRDIEHSRVIPSSVKLEVWKRDQGKCVICGRKTNLHYDHDLPYSLGGASITSSNIRLLCASCNLAKGNRIE